MRRFFFLGLTLACAAGGALVACVDDADISGLPPFDAGTISVVDSSVPATDSSPLLDSSAKDVVAPTDTGGGDAASACAPLDLSTAPFVVMTNKAGAAPPMTGGTIEVGDYVWTNAVVYSPDAGTTFSIRPTQERWHFDTTTAVVDTRQYGDGGVDSGVVSENVVAHAYTTLGSTIDLTTICGSDAGSGSEQFTVTDGGLVLAIPIGSSTFVNSYAKQ